VNVWPKFYVDALNVWGGAGGGFINTMLTLDVGNLSKVI